MLGPSGAVLRPTEALLGPSQTVITGNLRAYKVVLVSSSIVSGPSQGRLGSSQAVFGFDNLARHSDTSLNARPATASTMGTADKTTANICGGGNNAVVLADGGGSDNDKGDAHRFDGQQRRADPPNLFRRTTNIGSNTFAPARHMLFHCCSSPCRKTPMCRPAWILWRMRWRGLVVLAASGRII